MPMFSMKNRFGYRAGAPQAECGGCYRQLAVAELQDCGYAYICAACQSPLSGSTPVPTASLRPFHVKARGNSHAADSKVTTAVEAR